MSNNNNEKTYVKTNIKVSRIEYGDDIPQQFSSLFHWTPSLGASLMAGIHPYSTGIMGAYEPDLQVSQRDFHEMSGVPSWRRHKFNYILQKWNEAHQNSQQPVQPFEFLDWYSTIKVPPLDHNGKPIIPPSPTSSSKSAPPTPPKPRKAQRSDPLNPLIEQCKQAVSDPNNYHLIWKKLIEMSKEPDRYPPLLEYIKGQEIKYSGEDAEEGKEDSILFLTKDALRKRINPNARGTKKPKQADTEEN